MGEADNLTRIPKLLCGLCNCDVSYDCQNVCVRVCANNELLPLCVFPEWPLDAASMCMSLLAPSPI